MTIGNSTRNHEVTAPGPLLDGNGKLREPGWSRSLIQKYDRGAIKAKKLRIKEWDYYLVLSKNGYGVAFTLSDDGYIGLQSVSLLDFNRRWEHTETILDPFPMGKMKMPSDSSSGNIVYRTKRLDLEYLVYEGHRRIVCRFDDFLDGGQFKCDIELSQPDMDTLCIATPWLEDDKAFYYNQKINCMRASGKASFAGKDYVFDPATDFGTLDWGRGVWTYDNTWYWSSGNADIDGHAFGFNLGYGFGYTGNASENIVFYDGVGHKLDDVSFDIPVTGGVRNYMSPWTFTSGDDRFYADFVPVLDRAALINLGVLVSDQHQVFGRMTGYAVLDDGRRIDFRDVLCFAEHVRNKY